MRLALRSAPARFCLIVATLLLAGCYHATVETGAPPSAQTIRKSFASGWIYGLVPPSTVETQARCPHGAARVETRLSFVNQLVNWLTLGIYTPMQIDVTCAAGPVEAPQGAARTGEESRPAEEPRRVEEPTEAIPPGIQFVADRQRQIYVPIDCPALSQIALVDRFYYPTERAVTADGYTRSTEC